jgi:glycosyltransferase involved in cell wall biosynthesis
LDYDIVIATANRPDILRVSLPSMMRQSRPPRALIIADASDDHESLVRAVQEVTASASFRLEVFPTSRGAAPQRNAGLAYSTSPVIFFPDDDSVWYDDVAENVMRIYERDAEGRIGGVGQIESFEPPVQLSQKDEEARRGSRLGTLKYWVSEARHRILNRLMDNPLHVCGLELLAQHAPPDWLAELDAIPIERQIGFRMSYRAESVRRHRFDETLHLPRSALEDFELSYAVLHDQMLVEAQNAKVYHHRFAGARGAPVESGIQPFLNLCYIVCKHSPPGSAARRAIYPYTRVLLAEAILLRAPTSTFEQNRTLGMRRARRAFQYLIESPPEELTARYRAAFDCCLRGEPFRT